MESTPAGFDSTGTILPFGRSVLEAEPDHRIANHLALLAGYVRLKTAEIDAERGPPSREAIHALLDGLGAQIAAVARLHRALVRGGLAGPADVSEPLREVCAAFASGVSGSAPIIQDLAPGCLVGPDQVLPLSQIVAEVVTNALKHASGGGEPSPVLVRCQKDPGGDLQLEVVDAGRGLPPGLDPETDGGLGFRLVRGLGRKLGARIAFDSTAAGTRFRLALPAHAAHRATGGDPCARP